MESANVVYTTLKQVISRSGYDENVCEMHESEKPFMQSVQFSYLNMQILGDLFRLYCREIGNNNAIELDWSSEERKIREARL